MTSRDADAPPEPPSPDRRLVVRSCQVCEWEAERLETRETNLDCPWCHGPTVARTVIEVGEQPQAGKNVHAAELGRLGGTKGGHARAAVLTPKERQAIARNAARVRWSKTPRKNPK